MSDTTIYALKQEPSSELLHISATQLPPLRSASPVRKEREAHCPGCPRDPTWPPSDSGAYKTVKASIWPWLLGQSLKLSPLRSAAEGPVRKGHVLDFLHCCRANMAHTRQSRPDSVLGFHVKKLEIIPVVPPLSLMTCAEGSCPRLSAREPACPPHTALPPTIRCRANAAHTRHSRPSPGLGLQVKVPQTFHVVPPLFK